MLLLVMGGLIEWRGRNRVPGVAHLFLIIPGLILLLSAFLGKIKLAKHYYFIVLIAGITLILDLVVFLVYGLFVKSVSFYIGLVCSLLVESTMCFLFYILYLRIK